MTSTSDEDFVAFVRDASPRLLRTAWFVCGDPVQAEELVQAALEKVYLKWRRIDRGAATAYARKVVLNHHIDTRRRRSREVLTAQTPDHPAAEVSLEGTDFLVRALATLAPRERQVVVLRYYADASEQEVAAALGIGVGTVKSSASRGLAKLREVLVSEGDHRA
jgi:RNA polymerase sigma-70 factor (sigma-E family)